MNSRKHTLQMVVDDDQWNEILDQIKVESLFVSSSWAEYKKANGWQVNRHKCGATSYKSDPNGTLQRKLYRRNG